MKPFPNLTQPEGSLYCGPYCIVACLYAFDCLPASPVTLATYNTVNKRFNGTPIGLTPDMGDDAMARRLYQVTGIVTKGENPTYIESGGYNSLAAMIYLLQQFGLQAEVVVRDKQTLAYLEQVFPVEFELIAQRGVEVTEVSSFLLANCVQISLIAYNDTLHYIANNAIGNWFDSGLPDADFDWSPITEWEASDKKRAGASWLGITINVTSPT